MFVAEKMKCLFEENKVSQAQFLRETNTSKSKLFSWISGKSIPSANNLELVADYFDVSMDYFFDRKDRFSGTKNNPDVGNSGNKVRGSIPLTEHEKEVDGLNKLLAEKERTIQILMSQLPAKK